MIATTVEDNLCKNLLNCLTVTVSLFLKTLCIVFEAFLLSSS